MIEIYGYKKKTRPVFVILFNDMIVCCKTESSKGSIRRRRGSTATKGGLQQMEYINRVEFEGARIHKVTNDIEEYPGFVFIVNSKGIEVIISTDSVEIRDEWTEAIIEHINQTNEKVAFYDAQKDEVAKQRASEARALIKEQYTRNRVKGSGEEEQAPAVNTTGMRKFARKKNTMSSLTPQQKLEFVEAKRAQTDEMIKEESEKKQELEKQSKAKVEQFKSSAQRKYSKKDTTTAEGSPVTTGKLRKFASIKRSQSPRAVSNSDSSFDGK